MTTVQFIESLGEELKKVTGHISLMSPLGKETKINIFQFGIPVEKTKEEKKEKTKEEKKEKFPYILIDLQDGKIQGDKGEYKVGVHLLIGIYDDGTENQGKKWVLNIINDICERFLKDPILDGNYYASDEILWVIDEENEYPYHYGAMDLVFNIPVYRKEDKYA